MCADVSAATMPGSGTVRVLPPFTWRTTRIFLPRKSIVVRAEPHDLALARPETGAEHGDDPVPFGRLVVDDLHPACCPRDDHLLLGPRTAYGGGAARVPAAQLIVDGRGELGRQIREDGLRRRVGQPEPA
jgi:hypothetical protein